MRLILDFVLLALIRREQGLRLLLEAARLIKLSFDPVAAAIDAFQELFVHLKMAKHGHEDNEGGSDPEFCLEHRPSSPPERGIDRGIQLWS